MIVAVLGSAVACAGVPVPPQPQSAATQGATPESITIVDGRGKTITLEQPAERAVTIPIPSAAILMAMDGTAKHLVGMHPLSMAAVQEGILQRIYPEAVTIATDFIQSGFSPNVESLLTLDPDVVFQWADMGDDLLDPMENAGLKVIGIKYGDQEGLENLMRTKGRVLGKPDKAARIIEYHHTVRDNIAQAVTAIPDDQKPGVLYFLRYVEQLRVAGTGTYNDFYINLAGGKNVAAGRTSGFYDVSPEQILAWDPEIILVGGFDSATPQDVYNNPLFASVSAVVNRRVYKVPLGSYRWDPPSHESPLMWMWLADLLHPDVFDYELRAEMKDFYQWGYSYDLTQADIDGILHMPLNRDAAGYGQFAAR